MTAPTNAHRLGAAARALAPLALAAAGVALYRCTPEGTTTPSGCPNPNVYEPDDSIDDARAIELGTLARACLALLGDQDTFKLTAPADPKPGGAFAIRLAEASLDMFPGLAVYAQNRSEILRFTAAKAGENLRAFVAAAAGESVYVQVHAADGRGNYGLQVDWVGVGDPNEPDDTIAQARPMPDASVGGLYLFRPASSSVPLLDHLAFDVTDAGTIAARVDGVAASLDPELRLFDPSLNEIAAAGLAPDGGVGDGGRRDAGPVDGGRSLSVSAPVSAAGRYVVRVGAVDRPGDWVGPGEAPAQFIRPYTVTVTAP